TEGGPQAQPVDEPKQLYLARFEKAMGKMTLGDGSTQDLPLNGEILIAGQPSQDKTLVIEEVRIVSLWSDSLESLGGISAFAGPANKIAFEPGPAGMADPFDVHLSYPKLNDLKPACEDDDAIYPQIETLQGRLAWEPADPIDADTLRARVTIILDKLTDAH